MQEYQIRVLEGRVKFISRIAVPGLIISLLVVLLCSACSNQGSGDGTANLSPYPLGGERLCTVGSSFDSYGLAEVQDVQEQVGQQEYSYRRDDPVTTTLQFMHGREGFVLTCNVISATLVWVDPDRSALVSVETDCCWYRFMLQKLLRQDSSGAWFVVGYDSQPREYGPFLTLRTQNVDETQQNVPFEIVLPTYLPGNMESPPWISGPTGNNSDGDYLVLLNYISAEPDADYTAHMSIQETSQPGNIDFGQEGYGHDVIDGVEVKWSSAPGPDKNKASDIRFCQFFWNQGNTGFMATIYGFPQSEAMKVVTSMIQSVAS